MDQEAFASHRTTPHFKIWTDFKQSGGVKAQSVAKGDGLFHGFKVVKSKI